MELSLSEFFLNQKNLMNRRWLLIRMTLSKSAVRVSMKLVHNGNPNRTLAMILKLTSPEPQPGKDQTSR